MGIQILPQEGNFGANLGSGVGKGLAEQMPKELNRMRLAQGVKTLMQNSSNLSPAELVASAYTTPGMTPEIATQLIPLIQQQIARQQGFGMDQQGNGMPAQGVGNFTQQTQLPGAQVPGQQEMSQLQSQQQGTGGMESLSTGEPLIKDGKFIGQTPPVTLSNRPGFMTKPNPDELMRQATQLSQQNPYLYPTPRDALEIVNNRAEQQLQKDTLDSSRLSQGETAYNEMIGEKIQKGSPESYGDILGEVNQVFRNRVGHLIKQGMNPKVAAAKMADEARKFARQYQQFKNAGSLYNRAFTRKEDLKRSLDQARKAFEDVGLSITFKDDLKAYYGLSDRVASTVAQPLKGTIEKEVKQIPRASLTEYFDTSKKEDIYNRIGRSITPDTNIQTLAMDMKSKGYNPQDFLNFLNDNYSDSLTPDQRTQLGMSEYVPTLGDFLLESFSKVI